MKIGYFTYQNIRVAETFISDLILSLQKRSELVWFSGQHSIDEKIAERQLALGYSPYQSRMAKFLFKFGQLKGTKGYAWRMRLWLFLARKKLNKLTSENLPDVAYIDFLTSAILVRSFLEEKNIPYIVHVHGYDITSELNDPEYRKEVKKVFTTASYLVAASEYIKRLLILEGCSAEKVVVVRLGIASKKIEPMAWEQRLKSNPSIVFLGRLVAKKNPIALLYAFDLVNKKIPESSLTIIGQGPLHKEIGRCIEKLGLEDKVILAGALPQKESFEVMNRHWIYAQHSVCSFTGDKEGYAISPAEAAAHEIPVVSTIHNGIPEHVIEGVTGFLVPEFDYEKMAERIIYLIENPDLAQKMGRAGRQNIIEINNPEKRMEGIFDLLENAYKNTKIQ